MKILKTILLLLCFSYAGYYIVTLFNQNMTTMESKKTWVSVNAIVQEVYRTKSKARVAGGGSVPQLDTGVRYEYSWKGQTFNGEKSLTDGKTRTLQKGVEIFVKVNPSNPSESDYE